MAKNTNSQVKRIGRFYSIAGVVVVLFIAFNMVVENLVYVRSRMVYNTNMDAVQTMSEMNDTLGEINENVMLMVAGMGDQDTLNEINTLFGNLNTLKNQYVAMGTQSDMEMRRFNQATYAILGYQRKIDEVGEDLLAARFKRAHSIYNQELAPLRECAAEMLDATVEIGSMNAQQNVLNSSIMHGIAQMVLIAITVFGLIAMFLVGRSQIKSALEMQQKEEELEETADRLDRSRQKMFDSAFLNILTGMNNRYALEQTLEGKIAEGQFNIAVFDIDNFRAVNDQFGYEVGDEYLATVAERLRDEYSEMADMYHMSGNEFCLIFNDDLTDMQVQTLAEQVRQNMASPVMASGVVLNNTVTGSLFHVLPSENLNVTTLLMRLDNALHTAKRDGGNRIFYIR